MEDNYDYGMIIEILIQELNFFVFLMGGMSFQIPSLLYPLQFYFSFFRILFHPIFGIGLGL
jgi:hypothetical protein